MRRALILAILATSTAAFAQGYGNHGPCGGWFSSGWVGQPDPGVYIDPIQFGGGGGGRVDVPPAGGGGGSNFDLGDGKALLVIAVIAVAAAPLFVYALDSDPHPDLMACWAQPNDTFAFYGGNVSGANGFLGVNGGVTLGMIGFNFVAEGGFAFRELGGSFALRAPPKQHVDLSLSFGYRQYYDSFSRQGWFEIALPHRYMPFRSDAFNPGVGLEVRPAMLFAPNAIDARIDASIVVPFGPWATLAVGGRVFSFAGQIRTGFQGGLSFNL